MQVAESTRTVNMSIKKTNSLLVYIYNRDIIFNSNVATALRGTIYNK